VCVCVSVAVAVLEYSTGTGKLALRICSVLRYILRCTQIFALVIHNAVVVGLLRAVLTLTTLRLQYCTTAAIATCSCYNSSSDYNFNSFYKL
jgi:hypothetical protein